MPDISQRTLIEVKDRAIELVRFPLAMIETGSISYAAAYDTEDGYLSIGILEDFDESPNPDFEIHQSITHTQDHFGQVELVRDFSFNVISSFLKRNYAVRLLEEKAILYHDGQKVDDPSIVSINSSSTKRRSRRKLAEAVNWLKADPEFGRLNDDKFQRLVKALGECGLDAPIAAGEVAYYGQA